MNIARADIRPSRALIQLLALTVCISVTVAYLRGATPESVWASVVAVIAVTKVRLVVLDFLGQRRDRSPIGPALVAWAVAVLAIALGKTVLLTMVS